MLNTSFLYRKELEKSPVPSRTRSMVAGVAFLLTDLLAAVLVFRLVHTVSLMFALIFSALWVAFRFYKNLYPNHGLLPHVELKTNAFTSVIAAASTYFIVDALQTRALPSSHLLLTTSALVLVSYVLRVLTKTILMHFNVYQKAFVVNENSAYAQTMVRFFERHTELGFVPTVLFSEKASLRGLSEAEVPAAELNSFPLVHGMPALERAGHREAGTSPFQLQQAGGHTLAARWCLDLIKRGCDVVVALVALLALSPIFLVIALLIRRSGPGPVIYTSRRLGRGGTTFGCYKFRTMHTDADLRLQTLLEENEELRREYEVFHKLKNDPRITRIGQVLRKTSLDELPQLLNIVLGQMSLVGPRPYLESEYGKMRDTAPLVFLVQPGLTGYWQVKGRSATTFEERLEMDRIYVHHWDLWWDFMIFIDTVKSVVFRKGAF